MGKYAETNTTIQPKKSNSGDRIGLRSIIRKRGYVTVSYVRYPTQMNEIAAANRISVSLSARVRVRQRRLSL